MDDAIDERTTRALAEHGLSLAEHYVMCSVGYRVDAEPPDLVRHVLGSSEGDPRGDFDAATYAAALTSCIERGFLILLDARHFDAQGRRWYLGDTALAALDGFADYRPGHVEFTERGYDVHRAIVEAIFGPGHATRS